MYKRYGFVRTPWSRIIGSKDRGNLCLWRLHWSNNSEYVSLPTFLPTLHIPTLNTSFKTSGSRQSYLRPWVLICVLKNFLFIKKKWCRSLFSSSLLKWNLPNDDQSSYILNSFPNLFSFTSQNITRHILTVKCVFLWIIVNLLCADLFFFPKEKLPILLGGAYHRSTEFTGDFVSIKKETNKKKKHSDFMGLYYPNLGNKSKSKVAIFVFTSKITICPRFI